MAHVAKYNRGATGHMLGHYSREKEHLPDNIDQKRTHLNYNLAEAVQPLRQIDFIRQRLSEVKVQNRSDVKVLCDWIVTIPKDCIKHGHRDFFELSYDFLLQRYGRENVVSAYVHLDEATPHMHFAFIPIVPDKKKGGYKVSAKECITLSQLRKFHDELQTYLEKQLPYPVPILNGATKDGNKYVKELKEAQKIIDNAKHEAEEIINTAKCEAEKTKKDEQRKLDKLIDERKKEFNERAEKFFDKVDATANKIRKDARTEAEKIINTAKCEAEEIKKDIITEKEKLHKEIGETNAWIRQAKQYKSNAEAKAQEIINTAKHEARNIKDGAEIEARKIKNNARDEAEKMTDQAWDEAQDIRCDAHAEASQIIENAWAEAERIIGDPLRVLKEKYETLKHNIKNILDRLGLYESEKKDICKELDILDAPKPPQKRFGGLRL